MIMFGGRHRCCGPSETFVGHLKHSGVISNSKGSSQILRNIPDIMGHLQSKP